MLPNAAQSQLALILDALNLSTSMRDLSVLAAELSRLVHQQPAWTGKYVHSVLHGYQGVQPSPRFEAAVHALGQVIDGAPPSIAAAESVQVYARPGQVRPGAFIPANAVVLKCKNPACRVWFVRTSPRQQYHDPGCRLSNK